MSYTQLNKRQTTGEIIENIEFIETNNIGNKNNSSIKLIKLEKPYKGGISYSVIDNTINPFCSSGLFKSLDIAYDKFNLMRRNCKLISNDEFKNIQKTKYYL